MKNIRQTVIYAIFSIALWALILPSGLHAKLFLKTEIVSGQVVSISNDNIIELDDGYFYSPGLKNISLKIESGQLITIKYFIENSGEKKYIEIAPGKDSIAPTADPGDTTRPKSKL